jgi:hypothetical protein
MIVDASPERLSCQWWFVDTVLEVSDDWVMGHEAVLAAHPEGTTAEGIA